MASSTQSSNTGELNCVLLSRLHFPYAWILLLRPDEKASCRVVLTKVGTNGMLHKVYPSSGPYAGGIVFRRYFGIGVGIGYTEDELVALQVRALSVVRLVSDPLLKAVVSGMQDRGCCRSYGGR